MTDVSPAPKLWMPFFNRPKNQPDALIANKRFHGMMGEVIKMWKKHAKFVMRKED